MDRGIIGIIVAFTFLVITLIYIMAMMVFNRSTNEDKNIIIGVPNVNSPSHTPSHTPSHIVLVQGNLGHDTHAAAAVYPVANATDNDYYVVRKRKDRRSRKRSRSLKPRK